MSSESAPVRLTHLVKSAGCAAKIGPAKLRHVLGALKLPIDENLLIGLATGDDAGVYRLSDEIALVQTLDFFPPIVDDPYLFGQIAAANALSDVYAMGGRPLTAMNIVCFPIESRGPEDLEAILRGGAAKVAEAGAALVGGHSVEDAEPKFGLSVTGLIHPAHVGSNAGAQPGDRIVLTKPLGTGIITTAAKFDSCPALALEAACRSMSTLNAAGAAAASAVGIGPDLPVHAMTDVTGFSLLGHLFHLAKASGVGVEIDSAAIPLFPDVVRLVDEGYATRGGKENAAYLSNYIEADWDVSSGMMSAMLDPQTSGGLAVCVSESALPQFLKALTERGTLAQAVIGRIISGEPRLRIR